MLVRSIPCAKSSILCDLAKKKDDCESNRLFSVKSVLADGRNPPTVDEIASR